MKNLKLFKFSKKLIFRMSKRQKVQYAGMEEPKFLKAFKDKVDS